METMAMRSPVMLTSGASGRVNALLSLRALKSLLLLIKAFLLFVFLLPIHFLGIGLGRTTATIKSSSSSSSSSSSPSSSSIITKGDEKKQQQDRIAKNSFFFYFLGGGRKLPPPPAGALVMIPHLKSSTIAGSVVVGPGDLDAATRRELAIRRTTADDDSSLSLRQVSLFLTSRGDTLFTQSWTPTTSSTHIRGVVVIVHGLNEHSGRYNDFAKKLNSNGFKVYGMDWIGHGGSDGLHGYVHSLDYAVNDFKAFLEQIVEENSGLPCFCFGHSTGGAIVLKSILESRMKAIVKGVVLTSPAVRVQASHPIVGALAPIFSYLLPRYQFTAANKNGTIVSRDPEALIAKYSDPLVYTGSIRVRTGYEILRISACLQRNLGRLTTPFLVLHGTSDAVTDPEASVELHEKASCADKAIKLYKGLLHDLLFEPEREDVAKDILEWLNSRA